MPEPSAVGRWVELAVDGDVASLTLPSPQAAAGAGDALLAEVLAACDEAIGRRGVRRVSTRVPRGAREIRRQLHRAGFRLEGIERQAVRVGDDDFDDVCCYARLSGDVAHGRESFTAVMNSVTPRKRLIAHALVTDAAGRVLLCETTFKPDWELPGGIVEPFEPPGQGTTREMVEEMGWAPALGRLLVLDWLPPYLGWEDAVELVFDTAPVAEADKPRLRPDGFEVRALHWVEPARLETVMTSFGAARARTALAARASGSMVYAHAGVPVI